MKKYIVHGKGIYSFSLLPEPFRVTHYSYEDAVKYLWNIIPKALDQSPLCFEISEIDEGDGK